MVLSCISRHLWDLTIEWGQWLFCGGNCRRKYGQTHLSAVLGCLGELREGDAGSETLTSSSLWLLMFALALGEHASLISCFVAIGGDILWPVFWLWNSASGFSAFHFLSPGKTLEWSCKPLIPVCKYFSWTTWRVFSFLVLTLQIQSLWFLLAK